MSSVRGRPECGHARLIVCALSLCCALLVLRAPVFAKGGERHGEDYGAVLGVHALSAEGAGRLNQLWGQVNAQIDSVNEFYRTKIKDVPRFERFTWGAHSHRLLFHWGFHGDPQKHRPLARQVKSCGWSQKVGRAFYDVLRDEQARRNTVMTAAVRENLGVYTRARKRAIAAIIYDTHLLGDIAEPGNEATAQAVQNLPGILADLRRAIKKDLFKDRSGSDLARKIGEVTTEGWSEEEKAKAVLDLLSQELPEVLKTGDGGFLRRAFEEKGVGIR